MHPLPAALLVACCLLPAARRLQGQGRPRPVPTPRLLATHRRTSWSSAIFTTAYAAMDLAELPRRRARARYGFLLQPETVDDLDLPDSVLSRATSWRSPAGCSRRAQRRRRGPDRHRVPADASRRARWLAVGPDDDPYFGDVAGAMVRTYSVLLIFDLGGDERYEVSGLQLFYVVPDTVVVDGVRVPDYRLLGQLDLTGAAQGRRQPRAGATSRRCGCDIFRRDTMTRRWHLLLLAAASRPAARRHRLQRQGRPCARRCREYVLPFPDTPDQVMANFKTVLHATGPRVYRDEVLADEYDVRPAARDGGGIRPAGQHLRPRRGAGHHRRRCSPASRTTPAG